MKWHFFWKQKIFLERPQSSPVCQVTRRTVGAFFSYSLSLIIKNQLFGVSLGFRLASSCGKWCHHLSLGCGYLNELWTWSLWCQLLQWNRKLGSSPSCFKANPKSILDISSYSIYTSGIYLEIYSTIAVVLEWVEIQNLLKWTRYYFIVLILVNLFLTVCYMASFKEGEKGGILFF